MLFTKMHGAGNDFIIIDNMDGTILPGDMGALAKKLCAFHTGIGADGMMIVSPARKDGDFAMSFFNSDGSEGEMCGNGARCIARYGFDKGLAGENMSIETISGTVLGRRISERLYSVRLNDPSVIKTGLRLRVDGREYGCCYVELGVPGLPHAVVPMQSFDTMDRSGLFELGKALRSHAAFPKGANVSFVKQLEGNRLKAVTFERGVEDFTLACGTGCASIASALTLSGDVNGAEPVHISMPGGELSVRLEHENGNIRDIWLTGPAALVFEGEYIDN